MSITERTQPRDRLREHLNGLTPLEGRILQNYYLTFLFSQKGSHLQRLLLYGLNPYYDRNDLREAFSSAEILYKQLLPTVESLPLPSFHNTENAIRGNVVTKSQVSLEFKRVWREQAHVLGDVFDMTPFSPREAKETHQVLKKMAHEDLLIAIVEQMAERDRYYMQKGRPNREEFGMDPHESVIQAYIVSGKSTGSTDFDSLFREIRLLTYTVDKESPLQAEIRQVRNIWEKFHPEPQWYQRAQLDSK